MIRWAEPADAPALAIIFFRSVREGESPYTEAERAAWLPEMPEPQEWAHRLAGCDCAVSDAGRGPDGFMTLGSGGYIDLAFILPERRGCGIFRRLFEAVKQRAVAQGETRLRTHASLMAEPAFQAMGFRVIQREALKRSGQHLRRASMEMHLT